jgi:hypothetical protein
MIVAVVVIATKLSRYPDLFPNGACVSEPRFFLMFRDFPGFSGIPQDMFAIQAGANLLARFI